MKIRHRPRQPLKKNSKAYPIAVAISRENTTYEQCKKRANDVADQLIMARILPGYRRDAFIWECLIEH